MTTVWRRFFVSDFGVEYWTDSRSVWTVNGYAGLDTTGAPLGKRWECTVEHFQRYRAAYPFIPSNVQP